MSRSRASFSASCTNGTWSSAIPPSRRTDWKLACFDLRLRRAHDLTLVFAQAKKDAQKALDCLLARHYVAGPDARGLLLRVIHGEPIPEAPPLPRGDYTSWKEWVCYSDVLAPCIEVRWREAGYRGFSAYLTALIRYDLLLLGPHKYFSGDDWTAARMAELDAKTVAAFHERKPRTLMIDHLLNQAAGRKLTPAERSARMREIAHVLLEYALKPATSSAAQRSLGLKAAN
jgi:hypothetical protein